MALALLAQPPLVPSSSPYLTIDPCVDVDEEAVRDLVELELRGVRVTGSPLPESVTVTCVDGAQEIRVGTSPATEQPTVRTLHLPELPTTAPAAIEARSRELALAIAELIRRLEITRPLPADPPPAEPPPPPPVAPPVVVAPVAPPEGARDRWRIGALSTVEVFPGGPWLVGGDLSLGVSLGRWVSLELRAGGRFVEGLTSTSEPLSARAGVASLGAGPTFWSRRGAVGFALMVRAQSFGVEYRVESAGPGPAGTSRLGAVVAAAEPRLLVGLSRHVTLALGGAAGLAVHGIVVRVQGVETSRMSGLLLSGSLGVVVAL